MSGLLASDQLLLLALAVVTLSWAVAIAYVRPVWVVGLALAVFAFETVFGSPSGLNLGGVLVYPKDLAFGAMALAAAARLLVDSSAICRWNRAWVVLMLLAAFSLLRGVSSFGANLAGNDFRGLFYVISGLIFCGTLRREQRHIREVVDLWIGAGVLLLIVGVVRVMGLEFGAAVQQHELSGGRALYAPPTLLILQAALLAFFATPLSSRWARVPVLPWLLLAGVVLFQHRTVWIAAAIPLVAMCTVLRTHAHKSRFQLSRRASNIAMVTFLMAVLISTGKLDSFQTQLAERAEEATRQQSTFMWRVEGWTSLLEEQTRDDALVLGKPYGAGYRRVIAGSVVNDSPHSWYVATTNRLGLAGLTALLIALVGLFRRGRAPGLFPENVGALLVLSVGLYGLAYQAPETQGILLGIVALASSKREALPKPALSAKRDLPGEVSRRAGFARRTGVLR